VIVFQVQIADFLLCGVDTKRQAPVACNAEAPSSFAVRRQRVYFPGGQGAQLFRLLHVIEKRQHLAELIHSVGRHAFSVVLGVEPFQALMGDVPYFHAKPSVACYFTLVKRAGSARRVREFPVVCEGALTTPGGIDSWTLGRKLAGSMVTQPDFRVEVYGRYERLPPGLNREILEHDIAEVADAEGVLVLLRSHAREGKPFDRNLHEAIRHAALGERLAANWAGAREVFGIPIPELRKKLFTMVADDDASGRLAAACLTTIDEFRDEYGPAESEPRHPDIDSGRPWPLLVSGESV